MNREKTCCFTGHRIIAKNDITLLPQKLELVIKQLAALNVTDFIAGGALGFDTLSALAVLQARKEFPSIRLVLALPCKNQAANWRKSDILLYEKIKAEADEVIYLADEYYNGCMAARNRFMVDNSSHCVFYLTSTRGGTAYTVKYALENNITMHNIMIGD